MKYQIEITRSAEQDLIEISTYIAKEVLEPETAGEQLARLEKGIYSLENLPERYAPVSIPELAHLQIRKIPIDNYLVFYKITGEKVYVVRILYARRDWLSLL